MTTITFDTLKFVEKLTKAGVAVPQAKAICEAQVEAFAEVADGTLATKADVFAVKADVFAVKEDVQKVRLELGDIKSDVHVTKWMLGFIFAGVIALVLKNFFS